MKRFLLVLTCSLIFAGDFLPKWNDGVQAVSIGRIAPIANPPFSWSSPDFNVHFPAEFEPARGMIISWTSHWYTENLYLTMLEGLSPSNTMYIVVQNLDDEIEIRELITERGISLSNVEFIHIETNSCWIRDYAPLFVRTPDDSLVAIDMNYYADRTFDDDFPTAFAENQRLPRYDLDLFIEGGNIMTDGQGLLLIGDIIYANNPLNSVEAIDSMLMFYFGCERVLAIESMTSDGTGHIDMFTKFLDSRTILVSSPTDSSHIDFEILERNAELLSSYTLSDGTGYFDVVRIPLNLEYRMFPPAWIYNTYTNSLIIDEQIFLPIYNSQCDSIAINVYADLLPTYEIITVDCSAIINSGGAIHCIAMQYPDVSSAHDVDNERHLPYVSLIERIYPNPFNSTVMIETCCTPQRSLATIYDVMGKRVKLFPTLPASTFKWDATDEYGSTVSAGVYFIIIREDSLEDRQKIIYTR